MKAQSAMEYLMTYGWAILIIAVVLGVLFQLGVFNSSSFAPRSPPGSCQVLRTSGTASLVGQCSGILPKFVTDFTQINGRDTYISVSGSKSTNFMTASNAITVSAWVYPTNDVGHTSNQWYVVSKLNYPNAGFWFFLQNGGNVAFLSCNGGVCGSGWVGPISANAIPLNQWSQIAARSDGITANVFINGILAGSSAGNTLIDAPGSLYIDLAGGAGYDYPFNGMISNVQLYNCSLSFGEIQAIYSAGIGGAPVRPQNVVGWWPLNGDAKDYSGNNNNGAPYGVTYIGQYGK
jgi:hypothetical protein